MQYDREVIQNQSWNEFLRNKEWHLPFYTKTQLRRSKYPITSQASHGAHNLLIVGSEKMSLLGGCRRPDGYTRDDRLFTGDGRSYVNGDQLLQLEGYRGLL